jgi:hypothetical protein
VGKVTMNWVPVGVGSGPSTTATTTTNNATGHPQHIFIPGLRNSHHHHYPGSFSLVNHRPAAQSKAEDPTNGESGDKKSTAPHSSLTTNTRVGSDHPLVDGADTDDLIDDFCVDDEVDGCWKR